MSFSMRRAMLQAHAGKGATNPAAAHTVTAQFRKSMYALLKDTLGPAFWEGPDAEEPLRTP
jgi:hypothetical protein